MQNSRVSSRANSRVLHKACAKSDFAHFAHKCSRFNLNKQPQQRLKRLNPEHDKFGCNCALEKTYTRLDNRFLVPLISMVNPKIQELKLAVNFIKEGKSVVAYSPALDISTAGKDKKEAQKNFEEMVSIFFEDIIERNTIKDVLSDLGWKKKSKIMSKHNPINNWVQPSISQGIVPVRIPQVN
jgi:hypothetical protein